MYLLEVFSLSAPPYSQFLLGIKPALLHPGLYLSFPGCPVDAQRGSTDLGPPFLPSSGMPVMPPPPSHNLIPYPWIHRRPGTTAFVPDSAVSHFGKNTDCGPPLWISFCLPQAACWLCSRHQSRESGCSPAGTHMSMKVSGQVSGVGSFLPLWDPGATGSQTCRGERGLFHC